MSEAISWTALGVIKSRLQQITTPNGYLTNLGAGLITRSRDSVPDEPTTPFVLIVGGDIVENEDKSSTRSSISDMDVTVEFAVPYGTDEAQQPELLAHNGRQDIVRALRGAFRKSAPGLRSLNVTGSRIGSPEDGASIVIAQVTARVGLSESTAPATANP